MNSVVICFFAFIVAASATLPITYVKPASVAVVPSYRESVLPAYNYYRVANLPADRYPPGIDPFSCPNYPYCGTIVPSIVPSVRHVLPAPIAHLPGFSSRYYVY